LSQIAVTLKKVADILIDANLRALKAAIIEVSRGHRIGKSGVYTDKRPKLNFIAGTGITITVAENPAEDTVDVTIGT